MDQRSFPTILRIFLLVWVCQEVQPANILMVGFVGKGSHFLCLLPIGRSLVRQGHNVSLLTSDEYMERANDPELRKLFNFEIYKNTDPRYNTKKYFHLIEELGFSEKGDLISFFKTMTLFNEVISKTCQFVLEDKEMMKRFEKLDAIVTDMGWPCGALIKLYLKKYSNNSRVRLIWTVPSTPNVAMSDISGSPINPAYQPAVMTSYTSNMTFIERTINTLSTYGLRLFMKMASHSFFTFAEGFGLRDELAILDYDLAEITDLVLANFDFAIEFPFSKIAGLDTSRRSYGRTPERPPSRTGRFYSKFWR